jgi:hypothetical protein
MSQKIELIATAKDGKLVFHDQAVANALIWKIKPDEQVVVTIKRRSKNRTDQQNRYYWGAIIATISAETGSDPDDIHEALKRKFLEPEFKEFAGMKWKIPGSTTKLDTSAMTTYTEQ